MESGRDEPSSTCAALTDGADGGVLSVRITMEEREPVSLPSDSLYASARRTPVVGIAAGERTCGPQPPSSY